MLNPKILILTNNWVWNSPLFGPVAKMASFFNADHGLDQIMDKLHEKVSEGYSILIFPEAHRSVDGKIQRFHRGAFYLAEKLNLDILPVVIFGTGDFLGKGVFWGRHNAIFMKVMKRISPDDETFGSTYSEKSRKIRQFYKDEYLKIKDEYANARYYRKKLILSYIYKGPVLEWYLRVKMMLADNYSVFDRLVPDIGRITDIGCGYGYISYMLMMTSENRRIIGVDYDEEKIRVASSSFLKNDSIDFVCADITNYALEPSEAFILSDVLHYLNEQDQEKLLRSCISNLAEGGVIIIRDADADKEKHHKRSKFTEFISTKVTGFNKTADKEKSLNFTSVEKIRAVALDQGLRTEIIEESEHTSNTLLIIRK